MRVTVLGAGYMGSALALVARGQGHEVALWGTWLDDALLAPVREGDPHPRLQRTLEGIAIHAHAEHRAALARSDAVLVAVTSDGVLPVLERVAAEIPPSGLVGAVSKGFLRDRAGRRVCISRAVAERHAAIAERWTACGGPAKAMEVARGVPTAFVFAAAERERARALAALLGGGHVRVEATDDLSGVECCMALKNAYATAGGLWDGLCAIGRVDGGAAHNAKAQLFAMAVGEMARTALALGGRVETVLGLAGVGDLHVTEAAGRNRAYGEAVGRGGDPAAVARDMEARGQLTEGYPAIRTAWELANERGLRPLPLLGALHAIVYEGAPVEPTLRAVCAS
jgi:glycerol-3-phosphate dehydrogenase (NAD(P)+)